MCKTPPPPLANGQERSGLQHLESCKGVLVVKTHPIPMGRREVVCNIWNHAPELGLVRLSITNRQERIGLKDI